MAPDRHFRLGGLVEAGSVKKNGQEVRFTVTDTHKTLPVVYRGLLPDLFREGQGVVAEGSLGADGVFTAREVLAKHDENYMPPEVAKALKEAGQWRGNDAEATIAAAHRLERSDGRSPLVSLGGVAPSLSVLNRAGSRRFASLQRLPPADAFADDDRCGRFMIPELGHFALILALAVALVQGTLPLVGAVARRCAADGARPHRRAHPGLPRHPGLRGAHASLRHVRLLRRQRRRQLAFGQAADLQDQRRVGQPRGLDAAVGADPVAVRRRGRDLRRQPARHPAQPRARHPGADRRRLPGLPALHLEPLRAPVARAARRQRPQPAAAGSRPRLPSAAALSRLCRLLGDLRLRHRRAARGPGRRRLGALGAAVDARRLVLPHPRHRARQLVGLLHPRLGRLLVLGSGRERLADAVARRHRAAAFGHRRREARCAEELDGAPGHPRLLALPARHLPGALRRAHLGACLRPGSGARHVHPGLPAGRHRRRPGALRLARAEARVERPVPADQPRRRADPEQPAALHARPPRCFWARSTRSSSTF